MQASVNTYLKYIDLVLLENWSVQGLLDANFNYSNKYEQARIGDFLIRSRNIVNIEDDVEYNRVTVKINNNGVILRDTEKGINIGTKKQYRVNTGQFIISKIDARNGAFGIIPNELDNAIVTNDFPLFDVNTKKINPQFLLLITTTKAFIKFAQSCSSGTTNRQRMDIDMFLNQKIPLPKLEEQDTIVKKYYDKLHEAEQLEIEVKGIESEIINYLNKELGLKVKGDFEQNNTHKYFRLKDYSLIERWDDWNNPNLEKSYSFPTLNLLRCLDKVKSKISKVDKKEFKENGRIPIISQEQDFISGFTDLDIPPIFENQPLILFGDHSQTLKYVDFPFIVGADGIRILKTIKELNPLYFYYFLETVKFNTSQKYTRHFKYLAKEQIPVPPIEIQNKIAGNILIKKEKINSIKLRIDKKRIQAIEEFEKAIFNS